MKTKKRIDLFYHFSMKSLMNNNEELNSRRNRYAADKNIADVGKVANF